MTLNTPYALPRVLDLFGFAVIVLVHLDSLLIDTGNEGDKGKQGKKGKIRRTLLFRRVLDL